MNEQQLRSNWILFLLVFYGVTIYRIFNIFSDSLFPYMDIVKALGLGYKITFVVYYLLLVFGAILGIIGTFKSLKLNEGKKLILYSLLISIFRIGFKDTKLVVPGLMPMGFDLNIFHYSIGVDFYMLVLFIWYFRVFKNVLNTKGEEPQGAINVELKE